MRRRSFRGRTRIKRRGRRPMRGRSYSRRRGRAGTRPLRIGYRW